MKKYYYDLHTHSCLSPCADDDNTPNNLLGMASLAGIEVLALTDHNSTKNCPAFFKAAKNYGIIPIAGMELTTSEDIHAICLFKTLSDAMAFDRELDNYRVKFENRPKIFGNQLILDENDNIIEEEKYLLSNATEISIEDAPEIVSRFNGVCYPAHIDRESNGIIATLGTFPESPYFSAVEFHNAEKIAAYKEKYAISDKHIVISSDSHYLTDIKDKENYFEIEEDLSDDEIGEFIVNLLRKGCEV